MSQGSSLPVSKKVSLLVVALIVVLKTRSGLNTFNTVAMEKSLSTDAGARSISGSNEKRVCWVVGFTSTTPGLASVGDEANLINFSGTARACAGDVVIAINDEMRRTITDALQGALTNQPLRMSRLCLLIIRMV